MRWEVLRKASTLDNSTSMLVVTDGVGGLRNIEDVERKAKYSKLMCPCFLSIKGCKNTVRGIANSSLKPNIFFLGSQLDYICQSPFANKCVCAPDFWPMVCEWN